MPFDSGKVLAYSYSDPLFESVPEASVWGRSVDQVYHDQGDRQQLQQLLEDCQLEPIACVLVRRLDELGDSVQQVSDRLAQFETLGVSLLALETELTSVPNSSLRRSDLLRLLGTVQDRQRQRQLKHGHARNRIKALPPPGRAPYGYRRGKDRYAIDRATAPVVKEFFDYFLLYGSLRGSVRYLQKKYSKTISASTGKRWLTSPVYRGDLQYHTGEVIRDTHPAILSRDEAAQVDRLLRRNRRMPPRTASAPRSLSGLVACATCQSPMKISRVSTPYRDREYLYLRPVACPQQPRCRAIAYAEVLQRSIAQICQDLPSAVASAQIPEVNAIQQGINADISAKQTVLAQLPALVEQGILDTETADLRSYRLRAEIAKLQAQAAQLPPANLQTIAQVVSLPQFWLDLSEAERRFYFREFIRQIQIVRQGQTWHLQIVFIF